MFDWVLDTHLELHEKKTKQNKTKKNRKKTSVSVKSCKYFYFVLRNVHIIFFLVIKLKVGRKNVKERKFNNNSLGSPLLGFNLDLCMLFQCSKKDKLELLECLGVFQCVGYDAGKAYRKLATNIKRFKKLVVDSRNAGRSITRTFIKGFSQVPQA